MINKLCTNYLNLNIFEEIKLAQPVLFRIPNRKVIFIATPKAGNSSILHAMAENLPDDSGYDGKTVQSKYRQYAITRADAFSLRKDHLIFSLVRNPWDHVVSHYADKVCGGKKLHERLKFVEGFYHKMPFDEYLAVLALRFSEIKDVHVRQQVDNFFYRGAYLPHYVLRYESFAKDFLILKKLLQAEGVMLSDLEQKNKSRRKPYLEMYKSKDHIQLVRKIYAKDVRFFGYGFK